VTSPALEELREAALGVKRAEQAYRDALGERDRMLVDAYGRYPLHEIAAAALVRSPRVLHVVARDG